MARDFESFIVDPSLLDPSIDTSNLRTTTDTREELLSDVPDYAGIQFDPTRTSYLDDLYALYSGQLPMIPTATTPVVGLPANGGGGGGVGVETPATITPSTPITTDLTDDQINEFVTEDTTMPPMLSPDMIGDIDTTPVDTTPVDTYTSPTSNVAPDGTTMARLEGYLDGIDLDNPFAGTPVSTPSGNNPLGLEDPQSLAIGPDGAVDFGTGGLEDEGQAVGEEFAGTPVNTPSGNNPFGLEDPQTLANQEFARQNTGLENLLDQAEATDAEIYGEPLDAEDYLGTSTPQEINIDTQVVSNPQAVNTILGPDGITYDAVTGNPIYEDLDAQAAATSITPETENALSQAFRLGKKALDSGMQTISQVGQSIADSVKGTYNDLNRTVEVPGLGEIDIGKTLGGLAINAAFGAPVSLVKYAMDKMPKSTSQLAYEGYTSEQQAAVDKEFGPGGLLDGYNAVSAFGKDAKDIAQERLDERLDNVGIDQRTINLAKLVETLGGDVSAIESTVSGDINPDGIGDASVAEAIAAADRAAAQAAAQAAAEAAEIDRQQREKDAADAADASAQAAAAQAAAAQAAAEAAEIDRQQREKDAADAAAAQAARDAIRERDLGTGPQFEGGRDSSGTGGGWGNSATGGGWCFDPSTPIQMADGSEKKIKEIQLGDNTKGGEVTGVFQFKAADEIHDYKGVTVAGSHFVKEDGRFIMVKDSPLAVKIDKIPVVYSLDTSGRRIFINDIEFADYNGDGIAKGFLSNAGVNLPGFDKEVLRQVENRLI